MKKRIFFQGSKKIECNRSYCDTKPILGVICQKLACEWAACSALAPYLSTNLSTFDSMKTKTKRENVGCLADMFGGYYCRLYGSRIKTSGIKLECRLNIPPFLLGFRLRSEVGIYLRKDFKTKSKKTRFRPKQKSSFKKKYDKEKKF